MNQLHLFTCTSTSITIIYLYNRYFTIQNTTRHYIIIPIKSLNHLDLHFMAVSDIILNIAMFECFSSAQLRGVVVDYEGGGGAAESCMIRQQTG